MQAQRRLTPRAVVQAMFVRKTQLKDASGDMSEQLPVPAVFEKQDVCAVCLLMRVRYLSTPALRYE